jgi:hypothetical protein
VVHSGGLALVEAPGVAPVVHTLLGIVLRVMVARAYCHLQLGVGV